MKSVSFISTNRSLLKDFRLLAVLIAIVTILLSFWFALSVYHQEQSRVEQILLGEAGIVEGTFVDSIDYTEHLVIYMIKQIKENGGYSNAKVIHSLLNSFRTESKVEDLLSWSTFMWYNDKYDVIVEGRQGVLSKPLSLARRDYMPYTSEIPGKLFLGKPVIGGISGQWVIPGGVGAVDNNGRFVGGIVMGFNIERITNKLEAAISQEGVSFALLGSDFSEITKTGLSVDVINKLKLAVDGGLGSGLISNPDFFSHDNEFIYFQKVNKYPYILVLKYNKFLGRQLMLQVIKARIAEFFAIGFCAVSILLFLYKRIIAPIVKLSVVAQKIAGGEYQHRAEIAAGGEIAELIASFNYMLQQVEDAKNNLESKVKERTLKLEQTTDKLRSALLAKDEFLNNMSHEIRLPTSCILAMSEMLECTWQEMPELKKIEAVNNIHENCKRLFELLSNLLDLAKSKAGKMSFEMQPGNLAVTVGQVITEMAQLAALKNLNIEFTDNSKDEKVVFDHFRITQVVRNLLANAIKFTAVGKITLIIEKSVLKDTDTVEKPYLMLKIIDSGVGILDSELSTIFDPFIQSSKTKTNAGGTGLGLAICKEIIAQHHGLIWAENNQNSAGASFYVALKLI